MNQNTAVKIGIALALLTAIACSQSNIDPQKKAALDNAFQAGLLTQDEYNAKLRALSTNAAPAKPSAQSASLPNGNWTIVTISDPMFNMPAYRVRIPSDWKFEGAVVRTACEGPQLVYRAESPDGTTGVQVMPKVHWVYSQNNQVLQQSNKACSVHAPVPALKQAPEIAAAARPHPEIVNVEPWTVPGSAEFDAKLNAASENQARAYGNPNPAAHTTSDAARVRIRYNYQGHAEEELMTISTATTDEPVAVMGGGYGNQSGWAHALRTDIFVSAVRAPQGKLDALLPSLQKGILVQMVAEYDQAVLAFNAQQFQKVQEMSRRMFQNTLQQGEISHQQLMASHNSYMQWQQGEYAKHNAQFAQEMMQKDANNKNFVDYVSNQTYYMNPETGGTVTVKDVPGSNGVVTPSVYGGWVQLQPISH
jgi:hypothetical protein